MQVAVFDALLFAGIEQGKGIFASCRRRDEEVYVG